MGKPSESLVNLLTEIQKQIDESVKYGNDLAIAQTKSGVLVMTLLQLLSEKGILSLDEVHKRMEANEALVISPEGDCVAPLSSILEKGGSTGEKK